MCSAMGLYPVMGQDLYLLAPPVFEHVEVQLGGSGRTVTIEVPGAGPDRPYIAAATLDSEPLDRAWIRHNEIARGATLRFELAENPTRWAQDSAPPSPLASSP
jgi:putative alpha-1,2-mannosidase